MLRRICAADSSYETYRQRSPFVHVALARCAARLLLPEPAVPDGIRHLLLNVQNDLFEVGAELSMPDYPGVDAASVTALETALDALNAGLPPLKEFVLPGGGRAAAACHLARTICRRAERRAFELAARDAVRGDLLHYLNRLSDLLFVIARCLARQDGGTETHQFSPGSQSATSGKRSTTRSAKACMPMNGHKARKMSSSDISGGATPLR